MKKGRSVLVASGIGAVILLVAVHCPPGVAIAQNDQRTDPPPRDLSPESLNTQITNLRKEIDELRNSPQAPDEWKELLKVEADLKSQKAKWWDEQEAMRKTISELARTRESRDWARRINDTFIRLSKLSDEANKRAQDDGRRLFAARHAELSKRAVANTPELRRLHLDALTYPRMDGSTSTQPLAVLIACRCFDLPSAWIEIEHVVPEVRSIFRAVPLEAPQYVEGDPFTLDDLNYGTWEPERSLLEFTLQARVDNAATRRMALIVNRLLATNASTHQAYLNLIEGTSDIGLLARPASADELKLARSQGVDLETRPCARDALVFIVNKNNPVKGLTTSQIRSIYSEETTNWKEVAGADKPITAYLREEESASQQLLQELVMRELPVRMLNKELFRDGNLIEYGMHVPFLAVSRDGDGIGFSVHYYEQFMSGSPGTRTIAVDGVEPTFETIRDGKYPYRAEVLVVTRKGIDPASPTARLRDWLLSPEGQAVVRESGYVPVAGVADAPPK